MASILRVNTLTDASSNNSIATSFVAGGSAKAWSHLTGTGTPAFDDSFNHASITDTATGRRTLNFTTSFGSGNYTCAGMAGNDAATETARDISIDAAPTTSAFAYRNRLNSGSDRDDTNEVFSLHGDLA
tara:strand:- start:29 stop:415 length:387 start_codon:yes stop_codon:yes gene_type:complete